MEKGKSIRVDVENSIRDESYVQMARIDDWHKDRIIVVDDSSLKANQFCIDKSSGKSRVGYLRRCLLGIFINNNFKAPCCNNGQPRIGKFRLGF